MTFTYDLTTDVGMVRLYIGDVNEGSGVRVNGTNLNDEEITALLTEEGGDWHRGVAAAAEVLAAEWARVADVTVGPRKETLSSVSRRYIEMARRLREEFGGGGIGTAFAVGFLRDDGYAQADESSSYG